MYVYTHTNKDHDGDMDDGNKLDKLSLPEVVVYPNRF